MRVLLVRLDGVGDAAVCVPLIASLRDAGHEVGAALTTRNAGVYAPDALIAQHVLERIPWPAHGSTPETTARAKGEIAAVRYDVALIASEEPEAFALAAGIRRRVGFTTGLARPLKSLWVRARATHAVSRSQRVGGEAAHECEVMFRLGAGLVRDVTPPRDRARLCPLLAATEGKGSAGARIVVQGGPKWLASGVSRETLRALHARLRERVRVFATPGDAAFVRDVAGVEPETFGTVRAWVEALASADAVVTVDTGAAHVAGMACRRVIDVFPDRDFDAQVRRWHPWAAEYRAFRASDVGAGGAFVEAVLDGV